MVKRLFFILSCILSLSVSYGANQQSEFNTKKRILTSEEYPILEKAMSQSFRNTPAYQRSESIDLQRRAISNITAARNHQSEEYLKQSEEYLKSELMQWALKELSERNARTSNRKHTEQKKKWAAVTIGLVSTILTITLPIIFSADCDCPSTG